MKKILFLFSTAIMLILFAFSSSALEKTGQCGENVYWEFDEATERLVISGEGDMWDYDYWNYTQAPFYSNNEIKTVIIKDGVTGIGAWAFEYCRRISYVSIPDTVTKIGIKSFEYCTSITSIDIGTGVTSIGEYAFANCFNLKSVIIPISVNNIGKSAFLECDGLELYGSAIKYEGTKDQWKVITPNGIGDINGKYKYEYEYHIHQYSSTVKYPNCTEQGFTTYSCECGYSYVGDYTELTAHIYTSQITKQPTHNEEGIKTFICDCGDTYTESVAVIPHTYNSVITPPSCTEQGYTTYSCECGDSYVSDYVEVKSHSYSSAVTQTATHLCEGIITYTCTICGDAYTEKTEKIKEHTYIISSVVVPTCEEDGYTVYACECGDSYHSDVKPITDHNYNGDKCSVCGKNKSENCTCNCHKSGITGFIWKIINFFNKLFKSNKICFCGIAHY